MGFCIITSCSSTKVLTISNVDNDTTQVQEYSLICLSMDTLVIDGKSKVLIRIIKSISQKYFSSRVYGGLAGYGLGGTIAAV